MAPRKEQAAQEPTLLDLARTSYGETLASETYDYGTLTRSFSELEALINAATANGTLTTQAGFKELLNNSKSGETCADTSLDAETAAYFVAKSQTYNMLLETLSKPQSQKPKKTNTKEKQMDKPKANPSTEKVG